MRNYWPLVLRFMFNKSNYFICRSLFTRAAGARSRPTSRAATTHRARSTHAGRRRRARATRLWEWERTPAKATWWTRANSATRTGWRRSSTRPTTRCCTARRTRATTRRPPSRTPRTSSSSTDGGCEREPLPCLLVRRDGPQQLCQLAAVSGLVNYGGYDASALTYGNFAATYGLNMQPPATALYQLPTPTATSGSTQQSARNGSTAPSSSQQPPAALVERNFNPVRLIHEVAQSNKLAAQFKPSGDNPRSCTMTLMIGITLLYIPFPLSSVQFLLSYTYCICS